MDFNKVHVRGVVPVSQMIGGDEEDTRLLKEMKCEAENYIKAYFQQFPGVKSYLDGIRRLATNQGYVETSNVNVAEELVNMIQTQRAYELNSKAIQTSDNMLGRLTQLGG